MMKAPVGGDVKNAVAIMIEPNASFAILMRPHRPPPRKSQQAMPWNRFGHPLTARLLAQTVACRHPLSYGIESLEVHHPHRGIRRRLRRLREQIVRGHHSFQPLADAGLLSGREADALACAERAGNLPWVLDAIADNIDRRHRTLMESVVETVQPAVIAGIGLLVFVICIGIFYPIVHLIQVKL